MSEHWVRDDGFEALCGKLFSAFPNTAPEVVVGAGDGDYGKAQNAFRRHGSHWSSTAVMQNRSVLYFVNDAAFLFLLPRFISCCLSETGMNCDVLGEIIFVFRERIPCFSTLFSQDQKAALASALQYVFGGALLEFDSYEDDKKTMRRILAELRK
jgi:hypothetical protein